MDCSAVNERFSTNLKTLMKHQQPPMSIKDLADQVGLTYEFIRKLVRGQNLPTRPTLINMASLFGVELFVLEDWVKEDRCAAEYGRDVATLLFNPETKALLGGLPCLAESDRARVLGVLKALLEETAAHNQ